MSKSLDDILGSRENAHVETPVVNEAPPVAEAPQPEAASEPEASTESEAQQTGTRTVPHEALHAEKQKVKRYTEALTDLERKFEETNKAWEKRMEALLQRVAPPQPQPEAPDYYADPQRAVLHTVSPQLQQLEGMILAQSREIACQQLGADKVDAAQAEFMRAAESGELQPGDYERIARAPNRFAAVVQWQKQRAIMRDPAAYEAEIEARILEKHGLKPGQAPAPAQPAMLNAQAMPTPLVATRNVGSRAGPAWSGPKPLQDIFNRQR